MVVISVTAQAAFFSACSNISSKEKAVVSESQYYPPKVLGRIASKDVIEASGIAASKCQTDILWTHNDSDDGPFIFAFRPTGESLGTWKVQNAENRDWEDIASFKDAAGKCYIYIGDIGDNERQFKEHAVYRLAEPTIKPADSGSNSHDPLLTEPSQATRFKYPDGVFNAETLLVHPITGDIYVLTKRMDGPSKVYKVLPNLSEIQIAQRVAEVAVPAVPNGHLTGGDISPDGKRVILCDYTQAYELTLPVGDTNFDDIWAQKPEIVDLGERKQGEAVTYSADGLSIFATSEGKKPPLIEVKRRPDKGGE